MQGPLEAIAGLLFGILWGLAVTVLPSHKRQLVGDKYEMPPFESIARFLFLFCGGVIALFGSKRLNLSGAGALAVLTMAFVAGIGWRKIGVWNSASSTSSSGNEQNEFHIVTQLSNLWVLFQPILFGLIGMEIQVTN